MEEFKVESNFTPLTDQPVSIGNAEKNQTSANYYPDPTQVSNGVNSRKSIVRDLQVDSLTVTKQTNVDKQFKAGENISAGQAVGLWGYLTRTDTAVTVNQAVHVRADNPTTNYDNVSPMNVLNNGVDDRHVLLSWSGLLAEPTGTILTREVRFKLETTAAPGAVNNLRWYHNSAAFTEGTVTWDTKPANTIGTNPVVNNGGSSATGSYTVSAWLTVTQTELDNIKAYGVTLIKETDTASGYDISDEAQSFPPQLEVRYTYEIQNGDVYLASGLATKYADGFVGFAQGNVVKGQPVKVRSKGVDTNQSGLTPYSDVLLNNTPGAIDHTGGTSDKVVGRALTATSVQVEYVLGDAT